VESGPRMVNEGAIRSSGGVIGVGSFFPGRSAVPYPYGVADSRIIK
jgi:hypothetical protein